MRDLSGGGQARRSLFWIAAGSACLSSAVQAQQTGAGQGGFVLEEVVVTAQKRDEALQEVPMAVTALSSAELDRRNIVSMPDLDAVVPGLTVIDNGLFDKVPTIRGVGNEGQRNRATTSAVAYHVDGVFLASAPSSMQDYLDVERIEVLRGPQGTVFGQNATGGVINVITRQPQVGEFSGYADVQGGSYDLLRARAYGNIPLGDTTAARASVQYLKHDSFTDNVTLPGADLDNADNLTGRMQFLWQPSETFAATLRAQYFDTEVGDRAQKNTRDPTPDPRELRQDFPAIFEFDSEVYSVELKWDWNWASLKSISSYQDDTTQHNRDADRSDGFYLPRMDGPFQYAKTETVTQEINLTSSGERRLDWIAGFFYYDYEFFVDSAEFTDLNGDGIVTVNVLGPDRGFTSRNTFLRDTWSLFSEGTFHFTDSVSLIAGFRYSEDDFKSIGLPFPYTGPPRIVETTEDVVTGRVNLKWDITENSLLYGGWASGWKPGTSNLAFGGLVSQVVDSTDVDAYEIGLKNTLANGRVFLNVAAYYYDYRNLQFFNDDPVPFRGGVDTLPSAVSQGLELETSALIGDRVRIDLNYSYNDSEIDSDKLALNRAAYQDAVQALLLQGFTVFSPQVIAAKQAAVQNVRGNRIPKTPEHMVNVTLLYKLGIGNHGTLTSSALYQYKDEYPFLIFNSPTDQVPSYDTINLNLLYEPNNGNWSFEFAVVNLEDDDAIQSLNTDIFGVGATAAMLVPPRQYLARIGYEF